MSLLHPISTDQAPAAIGPYSQAVASDGWIFTSGQIAIDPTTGSLESGGAEVQAHRVLRNLSAVLAEAGGGLDSVVRTTVYLANMDDFETVNAVYAKHFGTHRPARATVEVSRLPAGAAVEIDAVARVTAAGRGER